jgi:predicted dehydrogenase
MIRLAWIGCDDAVADYTAIAGRLQHAKFTAIANPQLERARWSAQQLGVSVVAGSFDELLAQHALEFDAVLVYSANHLHESHCRLAAEAGKHILLASPLALSVAAAELIIKACKKAEVRLMVGQPSRFLPAVRTVKQALDAGQLGQPGLLRIHRWEPSSSQVGEQSPLAAEFGGGAAMAHMLPDIDLANWLFGSLPTNVYAVSRRLSPVPLHRPDYLQVHLGFPNEGMALLDFTNALPEGDTYFSLSLIGSTGAAYADDHPNMQLLYRGGHPAALKTGQGHIDMLAQLQEFVNAIHQNREPAASAAAGRDAVLIAEAVQQSIESGCAVRLLGGQYELV